jgi:hypothetical protein
VKQLTTKIFYSSQVSKIVCHLFLMSILQSFVFCFSLSAYSTSDSQIENRLKDDKEIIEEVGFQTLQSLIADLVSMSGANKGKDYVPGTFLKTLLDVAYNRKSVPSTGTTGSYQPATLLAVLNLSTLPGNKFWPTDLTYQEFLENEEATLLVGIEFPKGTNTQKSSVRILEGLGNQISEWTKEILALIGRGQIEATSEFEFARVFRLLLLRPQSTWEEHLSVLSNLPVKQYELIFKKVGESTRIDPLVFLILLDRRELSVTKQMLAQVHVDTPDTLIKNRAAVEYMLHVALSKNIKEIETTKELPAAIEKLAALFFIWQGQGVRIPRISIDEMTEHIKILRKRNDPKAHKIAGVFFAHFYSTQKNQTPDDRGVLIDLLVATLETSPGKPFELNQNVSGLETTAAQLFIEEFCRGNTDRRVLNWLFKIAHGPIYARFPNRLGQNVYRADFESLNQLVFNIALNFKKIPDFQLSPAQIQVLILIYNAVSLNPACDSNCQKDLIQLTLGLPEKITNNPIFKSQLLVFNHDHMTSQLKISRQPFADLVQAEDLYERLLQMAESGNCAGSAKNCLGLNELIKRLHSITKILAKQFYGSENKHLWPTFLRPANEVTYMTDQRSSGTSQDAFWQDCVQAMMGPSSNHD